MQPAAPTPAKPFEPRTGAIVLAVCALALLLATLSGSWASGRDGSYGIGPLGIELCARGQCQSLPWSTLATDLRVFGVLSLLTGLAAAITAAALAGFVFLDRRHQLASHALGNSVFGAALFAMTVFTLRLITGADQATISWPPVFALGALIAGFVMLRKLRPVWFDARR